MDFYKVSCCGTRQLPRRQAPSSSADRFHYDSPRASLRSVARLHGAYGCTSLRSLYPPPAALPSLPMGFGMALAVNEPALNAYSKMTETQKQAILDKSHNVRSEKEMHDLVNSLAYPTKQ